MDTSTSRIVECAGKLRFDDLPPPVVHDCKRRLIDAIGCGFGAYHSTPARIARKVAQRASRNDGSAVIGAGFATLPELAAFANGVMIRYLDGNDTYPGGGGHPSDVIAAVLAAAEMSGAGGREALAAIVLSYEIYHALFQAACMRDSGLDHVFYTAVASAVGAAKVLGLEESRMASAVSLAVTPNIALHATRRGDLSMWKGCASANAARNGVFAAILAAEGMTGPGRAIDGSHGLAELLGNFEAPSFPGKDGPYRISQSNIKRYLSEYHSQSPITAALDLRSRIDAGDIVSIVIHTYRFAWHEIGSEPEKWRPKNRETADHSLPYIVGAVMVDGEFSDEMFSEERLRDQRISAMSDRISVVEDPELTKLFPQQVPCRMEIVTKSGGKLASLVEYPRGHHLNPMTDEEIGGKFLELANRALSPTEANALLDRLWRFDEFKSVEGVFAGTRAKEKAL
ncbi:MAG: MmgE/PrpD family protein [Burkholderiales bacterium]|nr:MmgE/PrpD family protein [Burkholderiales bacterium]